MRRRSRRSSRVGQDCASSAFLLTRSKSPEDAASPPGGVGSCSVAGAGRAREGASASPDPGASEPEAGVVSPMARAPVEASLESETSAVAGPGSPASAINTTMACVTRRSSVCDILGALTYLEIGRESTHSRFPGLTALARSGCGRDAAPGAEAMADYSERSELRPSTLPPAPRSLLWTMSFSEMGWKSASHWCPSRITETLSLEHEGDGNEDGNAGDLDRMGWGNPCARWVLRLDARRGRV